MNLVWEEVLQKRKKIWGTTDAEMKPLHIVGSEVFGHICHLQQTVALFLEKCIMHYVDAKKERFSFILDQNILYSLFRLAIGPPGIQISS